MALVCLVGKAEKNKNVEFEEKTIGCGVNLTKIKSFVNRKVDFYSNSKTIDRGKKLNKLDSGFSKEYNLSPTSATREKQVSKPSSLSGRTGEKALEDLDKLGSSISKLNTTNGSVSGMAPRRNKISILAFEVANTINKGAILFQSLSEENIKFLKWEILHSEGMQLVSTNTKELVSFIEADKREEFNAFHREVARFGNMCKHSQWHNLDRYFAGLDSNALDKKQPNIDAEKTVQELTTLAKNTAALYHELNAFDRFDQDYQHKIKEMKSSNLPLNGESLTVFLIELKHQRNLVNTLKKKSLWYRSLDEIVEKLVDIVINIHKAISELLGNFVQLHPEKNKGSQRLGEAGLALYYANIIHQINIIASRPTSLPPNVRDNLYRRLPNNIKSALPSRLQNIDVTKELSLAQVKRLKAEIDKTLLWLAPFATNTTKAHQGFGWVGEWAKRSNAFGYNSTKESNPIRLMTLHYVDKQKIDFYILELLTHLHRLVSFVMYRRNIDNPMKPKHSRNSPNKGLHVKSKMLQTISLDHKETPPVQEVKILLEEVVARTETEELNKSGYLAMTKKNEARVWDSSKSDGSLPVLRMDMEHHNSNVLDTMDGLR
ncbi:hypothetical protein TanjilG_30965 [Lupinus angustifolius]|uniref:DUF668 domain-containing protein n=1 Tax=Lupinus angustifolius TaxID=3871 RepID=A0A1J7HME6_LUPAN|nr:PREDICTED: uncharacterized protein LOC109358927 [Lupinus angustifolius]OIW03545.1 hypothetical protein TanjilG_30965 [Lupinus angustifolius]